MRVLLMSHTCMSRTAGQPKLHCLATHKDLELTALVPDKMCAYDEWRTLEMPVDPKFRFVVGHTRWHYIRKQWYLTNYNSSLPRLLKETQPDLVDIWHEPWSLAAAQMIYWTKRLCPRAKIITETEQNIYKKLPPPFQQLQDYSLKHSDFMVARNQEAVEVLRRKGYTGPVKIVPNAVDCSLFEPKAEPQREQSRLNFEWYNPGDFIVGYVGRLVPEKGLADTLAAVAQQPSSVQLVFIGDGPMREELEVLSKTLEIEKRVHFLGSKPLTELPALMNLLHVLVLPSLTTARWKEQFGRVLIEAGACKVAVIGSSSGAIPEVIGEAGLIFPEGNIVAFAECLSRLREDRELRTNCGEIGYNQAHGLFSWQCVADDMMEIYRDVLGGRISTHT